LGLFSYLIVQKLPVSPLFSSHRAVFLTHENGYSKRPWQQEEKRKKITMETAVFSTTQVG